MTICKLNIISKLKTSYIVGTEGTSGFILFFAKKICVCPLLVSKK
jgi:hypothetical protein